MTIFWIQAGTPRISGLRDPEDESICEAAETTFALESERVILNWNGVCVPLSYKHDLGVMSDDIISMLKVLRTKSVGTFWIDWPSNTFAAAWHFSWKNDDLKVDSEWRAVAGDTESMLNDRRQLVISKRRFCGEWGEVLERMVSGLRQVGYTVENLPHVGELIAELDAIHESGR